MKRLVIAVLGLLLTGVLYAQEEESSSSFRQDVTGYDAGELRTRKQLKLAKKLEREGSAINAIIYYERVYEVRPKRKVLYSLADLNRQIRDYADAEKWYKKLATDWEHKYKQSRYFYAIMLKHNKKYDQAIAQFEKFGKEYEEKDKGTWKKVIDREIEGAELAKEYWENPEDTEVELLGDSINTFGPEYSPTPYGENRMVYAAIKTDSAINLARSASSYYSRFFEATKGEFEWGNSKPFAATTNEEGMHSANVAFSSDKQWMYFTRCGTSLEEVNQCRIFRAERINKGWGSPEELTAVNHAKFTTTHPAVGLDEEGNEVLYFSSNREGGVGGMDIWYSVLKNDNFGTPKNMAKVNTVNNEITPFYDNENQLLYFSSDGHPNIGGFDIFSVSGNLKEWNDTIQNLKVPLNSSADDFYMALDDEGEQGFFISNREGGKSLKGKTSGDDIYSVFLKKECPLVIKGYVTDCEDPQRMPIPNVEVSLYKVMSDKNFEYVNSLITTEDDLFYLNVEPTTQYKINSIMEGYWPSVEEISTPDESNCDTVFQLICIKRIQIKKKVKNVYFAFDKANVVDIYKDEMDSIYLIMDEYTTYMVEVGGHTDSKGSESYNIVLSKKRAKAAAKYLVEKGVGEERIITKGYGESQPIAPNENPDGTDNPVGRQKNRRVEFKVIKEVEDEVEIEYLENDPDAIMD